MVLQFRFDSDDVETRMMSNYTLKRVNSPSLPRHWFNRAKPSLSKW